MGHSENCNWEKTKPTECAYRLTHKFCPHEEHRCNCEDLRIKGIEFHVENQDYFGTLAAVISLYKETGQELPKNIINDLMYLQENYKIINKKTL